MKLIRFVKEKIWIVLLLAIPLMFFYQMVLFFKMPFPGDVLVGEYEPYRSYSYLGYNPGSVPNKAQGADVIKQMVPWKNFSIESLKKGEIPLWNPHNFSGNPLMANFQSAVFYPLNAIFFLFPFKVSWSLFIFSIPILSMIFTFSYLKSLKLGNEASIFGSLAFTFSLYMVVWLEWGNIGHTLLFLPLLLLLTDKLIEKINYKNLFLFVLVSTFSILAGYIQGFFYMYCVLVFYFIVKIWKLKNISIKKVTLFGLGLLVPIFLSAFQLIPTLELFLHSSRGNYSMVDIEKLLNPIYYLITVIAPDFFGNPATRNFWFEGTYIERVSYFGLIPLIFAIFAIIHLFKKIEVRIFAIIFALTLVLSIDLIITKYFYLIPIPVISTTVPTRILSIFAFSGSILAAFGFNEFMNRKELRKLFVLSSLFFFLILVVFLFTFFYPKLNPASITNLSISMKNMILPLLFSFILLCAVFSLLKFKKIKSNFIIYGLILITFIELFYYFQKITPFSPPEFFYPKTSVISFIKENSGISRFWGYGSGYLEPNFETFDRTYSADGVDPIHVKDYTEFLLSSRDGTLGGQLPRPDANIATGYGQDELRRNESRQKILNILGVKYVLGRDVMSKDISKADNQTFPETTYKLVWFESPWQVYENLEAVPRIFMTNKYVVAKNKKDAFNVFYRNDFDEKSEVILHEDPKIDKSVDLKFDIDLINYSASTINLETTSNHNALLFISDTFYPGWEVFIDGKKDRILLADYAFRAVKISNGNHKVEFIYNPKSFINGIYIAVFSLVAFISILIYMKSKKYEV